MKCPPKTHTNYPSKASVGRRKQEMRSKRILPQKVRVEDGWMDGWMKRPLIPAQYM